jgi:hypothetical protein
VPRSDPTTYFGLWSAKNIERVCAPLTELGVHYEVVQQRIDQHRLEQWFAWDPTADDPYIGFHLDILTAELPKVGTRLVEAFPERTFKLRRAGRAERHPP